MTLHVIVNAATDSLYARPTLIPLLSHGQLPHLGSVKDQPKSYTHRVPRCRQGLWIGVF